MGTLFEKLAVLGQDLLDTLPSLPGRGDQAKSQDQVWSHFHRNILPEEEVLDWTKTNHKSLTDPRMNPWPVAHTLLNGQRFKVYEAELCEGNGNPGE